MCPICKKGKTTDTYTYRQSYYQAGGFGVAPPDARVHPACNAKEQRELTGGKIKLSELWTIKD